MDNNPCKEIQQEIDKVKNELDSWYTYKSKGAFIRSKEKWLEHGEKPCGSRAGAVRVPCGSREGAVRAH